jgi:general secretion pathway protein L
MTIRLFVRPQPPVSQQISQLEWALYSFGGERIGSGVDSEVQLQEVVAQYYLDDILVHFIVPASDFSYFTATIPAKQARYIQQALPYVIEDSVAEDIEEMYLVVGEKLAKQVFPVVAAARETMTGWYDAANSLAFPLYGMFLDAEFCLSASPGMTVLIDGEDALVYLSGVTCMRTPLFNLPVYLELMSDALNDPLALLVLVSDKCLEEHNVLLAQLEQVDNIKLETSTFSSTTFDVLCAAFFNSEKLTNLCSTEFPGNTEIADSGIKKWWPLAAVASLWFIVQTGFDVAEGYLHQRQAQHYREQSVAIYKQLFPAERTVASPRRQLEGKLRNADNSAANTGFLMMLGEAGYQLSQQPQHIRMSLNNMQYSEKRGELAMEITAPSLEDLDRYKQSISQAGYQVSIGSAIKEDKTVRGKLTVQGG